MGMRSLRICLALFALLVCAIPSRAGLLPQPVPTTAPPTGTVSIDDVTFNLVFAWSPADAEWVLPEQGVTFNTPNGSATVSGALDPDPVISYGIAATDIGAPSVFGFAFSLPIVPTGGATTVSASIVGGLNDPGGNGVSITPMLPDLDGDGSFELQVASVTAPGTNMGVDVGLVQTNPAGAPGAFYTYGAYSDGPQLGPGPGPFVTLNTNTMFRLSGGGDIAALTGFASIIPEPSSIALAAMGLIGLVGYRLRRKK